MDFKKRVEELLNEASEFNYIALSGEEKTLSLDKNTFCFTYCQVPIIYKKATDNSIEIHYKNQNATTVKGWQLDKPTSTSIFHRKDEVDFIVVSINQTN